MTNCRGEMPFALRYRANNHPAHNGAVFWIDNQISGGSAG